LFITFAFQKQKIKSIYLLHSTYVQPFFKVHVFYANVVKKFMIENNKKKSVQVMINEKLARL
jgi:hypothetical protein